MWSEGLMHGEGIFRQSDGAKFKGTYNKGKKEGHGIMEDAEGLRSEGNFHDDLKHGVFIERDKNGQIVREVNYVNGIEKPMKDKNQQNDADTAKR
jgi:antitoxin component YwqK of YwqJK toxin-antitoxin module